MSSGTDEKECRICHKKLAHTTIHASWVLDTLEGKVILAEHWYCVSCGTIRAANGNEDEPG